MTITHLHLQNYRNHKDRSLEFSPEVTLIVGPNGSGKTNIVEAVNMVATGKPFRAGYDKEVISHDESIAVVKTRILKDEKEVHIGIAVQKSDKYENASSKKVKVNSKSKRVGTLSEYFNTVLFSPLDMDLLSGAPSGRRQFLDNILTQESVEYKKASSAYTKARRQRNKVLELIRETGGGYAQLDYWNKKVLELGQTIHKARKKLIAYVNDRLNNKLTEIDPDLTAKMMYEDSPMTERRLKEYQPREIAAGTSLIGPHREDLALVQDGLDLASYASRGQQRTLILVLKLCELEFLEEQTGAKPVLLLDDIFSELDEKHRATLENLVHSQQTILTATEAPKRFEPGEGSSVRKIEL